MGRNIAKNFPAASLALTDIHTAVARSKRRLKRSVKGGLTRRRTVCTGRRTENGDSYHHRVWRGIFFVGKNYVANRRSGMSTATVSNPTASSSP